MFAMASRSITRSSAITSITSPGRPTARKLLFNRTNRRQNIMEFTAADPETGKCRVIVREEWPAELDGEFAADAVPQRRQAVPLGFRTQRLARTSTCTI